MARRPIKKDKDKKEFDNHGLPSSDPMSPLALLKAFVHEMNGKLNVETIFSTAAPTNVTTWTLEKAYKVHPITADDVHHRRAVERLRAF